MRAESARAFGTSDTRFAATSSAVKPITVNPLVVPSRLFLTLPPVRLFSKHPSKCRVVEDMGGCFATVTVPSKNNIKTVQSCKGDKGGSSSCLLQMCTFGFSPRCLQWVRIKLNKWRHPSYAPTQVICVTVSCLLCERSACICISRSATSITISQNHNLWVSRRSAFPSKCVWWGWSQG